MKDDEDDTDAPARPMFVMPEMPDWKTCGCGEKSTQVPCWDCRKRAREAEELAEAEARKGIPSRFAWAKLDAPELVKRVFVQGREGRAELPAVAQAVLDHRGPAVLFAGPAGSGKTSFAVACLRALERPRVRYLPAYGLVRIDIENKPGQGRSKVEEQALAAPVLLIDDLGQDKVSSISAIERIILARHEADLPTWVTTGLTERELEERYGAGIYRRLTEKGTALVVRFSKEFKLS